MTPPRTRLDRCTVATTLIERLLPRAVPPSPAAWAPVLFRDVHVRIADRPTVVGADPSVRELASLFRSVLWFGCCYHSVSAAPDGQSVWVETDLVSAASPHPLPVAIVVRLLGRTRPIRDLRFYLNTAPLDLVPPTAPVP